MLPNLHSATEMKPPPVPREGPGAAFTSGETGIRTPDTSLTPYNGLANRRLQPLGHLSGGVLDCHVIVSGSAEQVKRRGAPRRYSCRMNATRSDFSCPLSLSP